MSFKEGFEAIGEIKTSGQRLSVSVSNIEALEVKLTAALNVLTDVEVALDKASTVFIDSEKATIALQKSGSEVAEQSKLLPKEAEAAVARVEERISNQMDHMTAIIEGLTKLVADVVEEKLDTKFKAMETHFKLILRDELKDTRSALRDAMRVNSTNLEKNIDDASREIISEMPRGLFGRPQKK